MIPEELDASSSDNNSDPPLIHIATVVPEATLLRDVVPRDQRANPTADVADVLQLHADESVNSRVFYALNSNESVVGYLTYAICPNRIDESASVQRENEHDELMIAVKHLAIYAHGSDVPIVVSKLIKHVVEVAMDVAVLAAVEVCIKAQSQDSCEAFCVVVNALVEAGFRACDWRALPTVEPSFFVTWRLPLVPPLHYDT